MFVETIEAVSTGVGAYEIYQKAFPTMRKFFNRLKNGELKIAIFGAGGTGKSTLGKLLSGEFDPSSLLQNYQESITTEKYNIDSDLGGSIIVVPGQERREDTWDNLLRTVASGKIRLIIHVVSWGYHSFGELSYKNHRLYQNGMSTGEFLEVYTRDRRNRELDVLRVIEPHLSVADQKRTLMITLVTKQDLWWERRGEVQDYYEKGEYNDVLQNIISKKGSSNFSHEYRSASLVMENFRSGSGELLVPTTAGYDQRLKVTHFRRLLKVIEEFCQIRLQED